MLTHSSRLANGTFVAAATKEEIVVRANLSVPSSENAVPRVAQCREAGGVIHFVVSYVN